jgi:1-phosphofructokinase
MIAAVCANPCVDKTVTIGSFNYGGMNRIVESLEEGSGKGVNVALAAIQLGMKAACIGFMPAERNGLILERLGRSGCASEFVSCPGAVRINTKVLDKSTSVITELNEGGPSLPADAAGALVELAVKWAGRSSHIVLTGSLPPGCPADLYRTIVEAVKRDAPQCRTVLDAEGERLALGLAAAPFMVKPNRRELEMLCGRSLNTVEEIHAEAMKLADMGVALVAVSMGSSGAYVTDGRQAYFAPALDVDVTSATGAGDSMVAGMLKGLEAGQPLDTLFRFGMAAAASSVTTAGTGLVDPSAYSELLPKVKIRQVA